MEGSVEFVPAAHVRAVMQRIEEARQRAIDRCGVTPQNATAEFWEPLFEANAAEVLAALPTVALPEGYLVRYRYFGMRGRDLLVRPFVARASTDVEAVRRALDWHAPPDSVATALAHVPTQDVELLYRHFSFPPAALGVFEYWLAMQELWASARWAHSRIIATADELGQLTAGEGWQLVHPVEAYEPAIVRSDVGARLAVLLYCPLARCEIALHQIEISSDHAIRYGEPIVVAQGPKGYLI
jgi:hypothetical protein